MTLGILSFESREVAEERWQPLVEYLDGEIDDVQIEGAIAGYAELDGLLENEQLDFLLTNPMHYVRLRDQYALSGALATLVPERQGERLRSFGGVAFTRAEHPEVSGWGDVPDHTVAAVHEDSLGGYQAQAMELKRRDLSMPTGDAIHFTGMPHRQVVDRVMGGEADIGFVRISVLERLWEEGELARDAVRIIGEQAYAGFPFVASTALYPEWPLVHLEEAEGQQSSIGREMTTALLRLGPDHPASRAAGIAGFSVPMDYEPVEELARALRLPPYDAPRALSRDELWDLYRTPLVAVSTALLVFAAMAFGLMVTNRRLKRARQQAEQATRAKSEFLANMSHEIRTPMNAVVGLSQLLLDTELNERQLDYLKKIQRSSRMLLGIINDILDFSRIESGQLELDTGPFDLGEVIDHLATLFSEAAREKEIELIYAIQPELPRMLVGDSLRITQVLTNLLSNAIKFTPRGGTVELEVREEAGAGSAAANIRFQVRDSGIGMDAEQLERVFQPFVQADASTTRRYGGTGLGLGIGRRLVERMGGDLEVTSQPGQGSTFFFTLQLPIGEVQGSAPAYPATRSRRGPLDVCHLETHEAHSGEVAIGQARAEPGEKAADCPKPSPSRVPDLTGFSILLVEDDAVNQEVATQFLEKTGARVRVAENGMAALDAVDDAEPDLILMDLQMPLMDGFEASRRLLETGCSRTIIALSAAVLDEDRRRAEAAGMRGLIAKPMEQEVLYATLMAELKPAAGAIRRPAQTQGAAAEPQQTHTDAAAPATLPAELPGFDRARGLEIVGGDQSTYARLLQLFKSQLPDYHASLIEPLRTDSVPDRQGLHRIAHTLKGSAASVCAVELGERASQVEAALKHDEAVSETQIDALEQALKEAEQVLRERMAPPPGGPLPFDERL
ncbi:hybrid sensor histidine kinase/response regulator [Halorhodospira halophila]|uniref:hybrid sensor histidine kinase/response regulator n=1 Tax=Halorhodospira halophila TaxID=1053 RepID=UPI00031741C8|nr:PhnD/SsuA/transferrin family substrate-binding protein [Halorhodospira halophila]